MPEMNAKVLIVDDVETNLYVAKSLMEPYQLHVETADSGLKAIELIESGNKYEIIFMDHLMPQMDGIEVAKELRRIGYEGTIIVLTANESIDFDQFFKDSGFDDFISKPIDIRTLHTILNKWVGNFRNDVDNGNEILSGYPSRHCGHPKLSEIFCKDAKKAIPTLIKTLEEKDMKLFITTIHAMKAALANIGDEDKSNLAGELETAVRNKDYEFVYANADYFIKSLESLTRKFAPEESNTSDIDVSEDTVYLRDELSLLKMACDNYDDKTAYEILDRLDKKQWKNSTRLKLNTIRERLFFESDFDGAVSVVEEFFDKSGYSLKPLREIDGLDADMALEAIGGNLDVYFNTIKITTHLLPERISRMDRFMENNDAKSFTVEVHGLKSVMKIIGARKIGFIAEELEENAAFGLSPELYRKFRTLLMDLVVKLNEVIPKPETKEEIVDAKMFIKALKEARSAAEEFDSVLAAKILTPFSVFSYAGEIKPLLSETIFALESFDPETALHKIMKLEEAISA